MNNVYRISDFCHFIDVNDKFTALYNSLTLGVMFVEKGISNKLKDCVGGIIKGEYPENFIDALVKRRLIFSLGKREDLSDYTKAHKLLENNGLAILYLLTADGCNLGCKYCYIENALPKQYKFSLMTKETAEEGLKLFASNISSAVEEPRVILYGGEPLLNMAVVEYVVKRFNEMKDDCSLPEKTGITINTNATLITRDFLEKIRNQNVQIAVSLDGTKEMHDSMRPQKNGEGTYDTVIANCRLMREYGIDFGFSVTITSANIFQLEEILLSLYEEFDVNSIGFNIAINQSYKVIGMSQDKYAKLVTEKLINCYKFCRKKGIYEDRIMRKVSAFVEGYPYIYDCGAPGDQLVITPDRYVGVCQAYCGDKRNFVKLEDLGVISDNPIWKTWRYRSPLYQKQCYNCISLGICGGGCPYNAELKTGSIWGVDESFCTHSKGTVEFLIKDLYEQTLTE